LSLRSSVEAATAWRRVAPGVPAPKVRGPAGIGKTALLEVGVMYCFFGPLGRGRWVDEGDDQLPVVADGIQGSRGEVSFRTGEVAPTAR
jgi:hypothetical protein